MVATEHAPRAAELTDPTQKSHGTRFTALAAAGFAIWGMLVGLTPLNDNSFLTHLATGRLIIESGSIPRSDPYSFTAPGAPWVVQSWLVSVAYGLADRVSGLAGVRVFNALVVSLMAILVWRLTRDAISLLPRIAISALVCAVGTGLWVERPLMIGLLCLAALMAIVGSDRDLRWLIPIMWIWVNSHGSFVLGLGFLLLSLLGRRLDGEILQRQLKGLGWALVGTLAGAVNPLGPRLLFFPLKVLSNADSFSRVKEWQPPQFNDPWQLIFAVQLFVALALLLRRPRWQHLLPLATFAALALTSARNIAPASIVLLPGMAIAASGFGTIAGTRRSTIVRPLLGVAAFLAVLLAASSLMGPNTRLNPYPEEAISWLDARGLLSGRLVAPEYVGNYMEARFGTRRKVFIDDRVDMYPLALVKDSSTLLHDGPDALAVLQRRQATVVLWPTDKPLSATLATSGAWQDAWRNDDWVIFTPASER